MVIVQQKSRDVPYKKGCASALSYTVLPYTQYLEFLVKRVTAFNQMNLTEMTFGSATVLLQIQQNRVTKCYISSLLGLFAPTTLNTCQSIYNITLKIGDLKTQYTLPVFL